MSSQVLRRHAGAIAAAMGVARDDGEITFKRLRRSDVAETWQAALGGVRAVAKVFHPEHAPAFARECDACHLLGPEVAPRPLLAAKEELLLLIDHIDGDRIDLILSPENCAEIARATGQALGRLHARAPKREGRGAWSDYFLKIEDADPALAGQLSTAVLGIDFSHSALAHDDNAPSNLILNADGTVRLIDFESAQFRPPGWDLLTAGATFLASQPDQFDATADALVKGYRQGDPDAALPNDFGRVLRAYAVLWSGRK